MTIKEMCSSNLIKILPTITQKGSVPMPITYSSEFLRQFQNKVNNNNYLQVLLPRAINTIRKLRINKRRIQTSGQLPPTCHNVVKHNLVFVRVTNNQDVETERNMGIMTPNARLVRNKDHIILEELHDSGVDITVITETWLKDTEADDSWLNQSDLKKCNYDILMHNRQVPKKGRDTDI